MQTTAATRASGGACFATTASPSDDPVLLDASERRLIRLGFDIHDGPLQDACALAFDLRLFRSQLADVVPDEYRERALGRVDDLDARLVELMRELRELAQSLESRSLLDQPLTEGLEQEVQRFTSRADVEVTLHLEREFGAMTRSQRFAVLRIVGEALNNVAEHSGAATVHVSVRRLPDGVRVEVLDDGHGFVPERELARAAQSGRLGLIGMRERVRLLGGTLALDSRPGGPTTVSATIPSWSPAGEGSTPIDVPLTEVSMR